MCLLARLSAQKDGRSRQEVWASTGLTHGIMASRGCRVWCVAAGAGHTAGSSGGVCCLSSSVAVRFRLTGRRTDASGDECLLGILGDPWSDYQIGDYSVTLIRHVLPNLYSPLVPTPTSTQDRPGTELFL